MRSILAALAALLFCVPASAKSGQSHQPYTFSGDRYVFADSKAKAAPKRAARHVAVKRPKIKKKRKPLSLAKGFVREISRALPDRTLAGVVAPLAAKARELQATCGSRVISAVRHTRVLGSGRVSLHSYGRAVDMAGNPRCMHANLRRWPGGVSTDYRRVRHIHISYSPGGREWGARFAHYKGGTKRYAKKHRRTRYARRA